MMIFHTFRSFHTFHYFQPVTRRNKNGGYSFEFKEHQYPIRVIPTNETPHMPTQQTRWGCLYKCSDGSRLFVNMTNNLGCPKDLTKSALLAMQ